MVLAQRVGVRRDLMQERTMLDKDDVDKESPPVRFVWPAPGRRMRTLIQVNAWRRQINEASLPCGKL